MKLAEPSDLYRKSGSSVDPRHAGTGGAGRGAMEMEDMFSMEEFLAAEQAKDLVRFSTAGSVDDGKSTLIGRLLYDSQNVYEDHVRAVTKAAAGNVASAIDFAQERRMLVRGDSLIPVEQPFVQGLPGETPWVKCRLRSLGCSPCTGAIRSDADTIPKIIAELVAFRSSERANRVIDHDQEGSMELKKREGYF